MKTYSSIERLESRIAPAALIAKCAGHTLTVTGDSAADSVTFTGNGASVEVFDGNASLGIFAGVKNIAAKLDGTTAVTASLAGGGIAGSLSVTTTGPGSLKLSDGSILGGALAFKGDGNAQTLTLGTGVAVGKTLTYTGGAGTDVFTIGKGTSVGGNAIFTSVENGTFSVDSVITINGSLTFKNTATPLSVTIQAVGAAALNVVGKFSIAGGQSDDFFSLTGNIGGSATFSDRKGNNSFVFAQNSVIHGSLAVTTGAGNDSLNINGGTVDKNVTLKLGDGSNFFVHGSTGPVTIGGNLTFTGGTGNDTWSSGSSMTLGKNLTLKLGDGNNSVNASVAAGGTRIFIATGTGTDSVALQGSAINAAAVIRLGAGADTLGGTLIRAPRSAHYDGGAGLDHYTEPSLTADPAILISFEDFS